MQYGQDLLVASNLQTGLPFDPVYLASRAAAIRSSEIALDTMFRRQQLDAIVSPNYGNVGVTAASGYPNVTVPMGYVGQAPQGLSFAGRPFTEQALLAYAYAYEQASHKRTPPTTLNPALRDYCTAIGAR